MQASAPMGSWSWRRWQRGQKAPWLCPYFSPGSTPTAFFQSRPCMEEERQGPGQAAWRGKQREGVGLFLSPWQPVQLLPTAL